MEKYFYYIAQALFIAVAFVSVKEEINGTWAFRKYAPPHTIQSKRYHYWGWIFILIVNTLSAFAFSKSIAEFIITFFTIGFIYWLLFDIWYAKGINRDWYYLGDEAATDKWLKHFGKNTGKNKAYFCIAIIIALNITHLIIT